MLSSMQQLADMDRCDRCGARASVVIELDHGDLRFCAHHAQAYGFVHVEQRP